MARTKQFSLHGWRVILADLGVSAPNVLRRAALPTDLFTRNDARLNTTDFFSLWHALEQEEPDPLLALRIASVMSFEAFDPALFAACCSQNLRSALERISIYKRLIAPLRLVVSTDAKHCRLEAQWLEAIDEVPKTLATLELLFFVQLARLATRSEVVPVSMTMPSPPPLPDAYRDTFGVSITHDDAVAVTFTQEDAQRPFLVANEEMWTFFEPQLRRRMEQLEASATHSDRVRSALLECLPSGRASAESVAKKLGMSKRTLQRRLQSEQGSFQLILDDTREELARHYLRSSSMSGTEISFLLGFEDPNSFFRAFHTWTGQTPERVRSELRA